MMRTTKNWRGLFLAALCLSWGGARASADGFRADHVPESATVPAPTGAPEAPNIYALEDDSTLLRDARPGETPLQTLDRQRRKAKITRVLTGTGLVIAGPVLFGIGAAVTAAEGAVETTTTLESESNGGPWLMLGLVSTGTGIFLLCTKWEPERKWERVVRNRLNLGLHPSGKGALLTVRF